MRPVEVIIDLVVIAAIAVGFAMVDRMNKNEDRDRKDGVRGAALRELARRRSETQ